MRKLDTQKGGGVEEIIVVEEVKGGRFYWS